MVRANNRLTAKTAASLKKPGYYPDGAGLYLQVTETQAKSWLFRYTLNGKARWMGLGSCHDVSLATARSRRDEQRLLIKGDLPVDPIEARRVRRSQKLLDAAKSLTFDECATAYIEAHRASWRSAKHAAQWTATLTTFASPKFGALPVAAVDTALVMQVIEPLWRTTTETASRLRGRIESVLDWATVRGFRLGENPARWRGHLDKLLPAKSKVAPTIHHPAMPYTVLPAFMQDLRAREGTRARCIEFLILTAVRLGEALGATWAEVDLENRVWTIPAARMKVKSAGDHRVPLSDATLKVLAQMQAVRQGDHLFPGWKVRKPISNVTVLKELNALRTGITLHGFRSTFRDWCAEQTSYPRDVCEAALAHATESKVEAAYRRSDLFEKRAQLMKAWADYCAAPRATSVTPIRKRKT